MNCMAGDGDDGDDGVDGDDGDALWCSAFSQRLKFDELFRPIDPRFGILRYTRLGGNGTYFGIEV